MPLAEKDLEIASACIRSLRQHLLHPITKIVVPGQKSKLIEQFCNRELLEYWDETEFLDQRILDFQWRTGGQNRSGWIRQQFIKLTVAECLEGDHFLIIDADTLLTRDLAFMEGDRQILWRADDLVEEYYAFVEAMIGKVTHRNCSFVTHCMLFQRHTLKALKSCIEERSGRDWIDAMLGAIQLDKAAGMSEYEIYAHFLMRENSSEFRTRYWYNRKADLGSGPINFLADHSIH